MINIVGSGLAGLSAAITLAESGRKCNLISLQESQRAQSVMAEGGINAALNTMGENDSIAEHYEETMRGGAYLADPDSVADLTEHAPEIVMWLKKLGVPFEIKDGRIVQRNFGGQKKKRTAFVKSSTGKMLMSALIDEARKYEIQGLINRYSHHRVYDLITEANRCIGLKMIDTYTDEAYNVYGSVILACGGLGGLFTGFTTGSAENTRPFAADLLVKGVTLANLEMIQYHPTTAAISGKRMLVSEAARGEGGRFMTYRNNEPYYFMEELYPEQKNLTTRDVATRAVDRIMHDETCCGKVYLDMTHLDQSVWKNKLSDMRDEMHDYFGIDIAKEPFEISPGIHYFMGGIYVDRNHRTNLSGLYAAGECACQYHGANRLGGNSLLGAVYGGRTAAGHIADDPDERMERTTVTKEELDTSGEVSETIRDILLKGLGIVRNRETLEEACSDLSDLTAKIQYPADRHKALLAEAMLKSALERKESRGAHYREDYPDSDDRYRKTTVVSYDGEIHVEFKDLPERSRS